MDDDIRIECSTITDTLMQWRRQAYVDLGPMASFEIRGVIYDVLTDKWGFTPVRNNASFSNIVFPGYLILPRHFMEVYYADFFEVR